MSRGTTDIAARLALLFAVQAAAVVGWDALTRGAEAPIPSDSLVGGLGAIWMVPAFWLAAWQVLALSDLRRALAGAAVTLGLCVATFGLALLVGVFSAGLLSLPMGALGVVAIARFVARREAAEDGAPLRAWPHVAGLLVALAGLLPAVLSTDERFLPGVTPQAATAAGLALLLLPQVAIFLPHAVLAIAARPRGPAPWRRGAAMLALALVLPMPALGPGWMFALPGRVAAEHAEHVLFRQAGGWERGLQAGQVVNADLGLRQVAFTVPEGWLGLYPRGPQPVPARSIEIAPDPRLPSPAPPIRRLRLAPAVDDPLIPAGAAGAGQADWHPVGCTVPDGAGVALCRELAFRDGRAADEAVAAMLPEAALTRRMLTRYAIGPSGWMVLAPGLRGTCYVNETCRLRFAAPDAIEAVVDVAAAARPDLAALRPAVAALLDRAAGLALEPP